MAIASDAQQRKDVRLERRRRRIAEAALALFATRGYNATSVEEVVAAAKVSKSAFYEHFESKEDCFRVLLEQEGGELVAAVRLAARDGSIRKDMLLLYPEPDVLSKHTLVPLKPNGDRVGRLLMDDPELQRLAVKYGFRTNDQAAFSSYLKSRGVAQPPQLVNVIEPPAFEPLEAMIAGIERLY